MTAFPGLRLLDYLIEDHHTDRGGDPLLIPCLHEELEKDVDLLAAGAQRSGGTLFFLSSPDKEWEPPKAPISAHRAAGRVPAPV